MKYAHTTMPMTLNCRTVMTNPPRATHPKKDLTFMVHLEEMALHKK